MKTMEFATLNASNERDDDEYDDFCDRVLYVVACDATSRFPGELSWRRWRGIRKANRRLDDFHHDDDDAWHNGSPCHRRWIDADDTILGHESTKPGREDQFSTTERRRRRRSHRRVTSIHRCRIDWKWHECCFEIRHRPRDSRLNFCPTDDTD